MAGNELYSSEKSKTYKESEPSRVTESTLTTISTVTISANPTTAVKVVPKKLPSNKKQPDQNFLEAPFKELEATEHDEEDGAIVFEDYSLEVSYIISSRLHYA